MPKSKVRLFLFLILILVILFMIALVFRSQFSSTTTEKNFTAITPTQVPPTEEPFNPDSIVPTFTGADDYLPPEVIKQGDQIQNLKAKTPLKEPNFSMVYDYANAVFIVTLNEPKDQNRQLFQTWLSDNYPDITGDQFTFK